MKSFFIILLTVIFMLCGCKTDFGPTYPENYIDPNIIGVWYNQHSVNSQGLPNFSFSCFKIDQNGYIYNCGIEFKTGKLSQYSKTKYSKIVKKAYQGEVEFYVPQNGMAREFSYVNQYEVNDSALTFYSAGGHKTIYKKSKIGNVITEPINSEFFAIADSDTFVNAPVWYQPSAYCGFRTIAFDSLVFDLYARSMNNSAIRIRLENFNGPGSYILGESNDGIGYYEEIGGCMIAVSFTEDPNSGSITIDTYDLQNNICSGTFEFYVFDHHMEFTEGKFRIPIYN